MVGGALQPQRLGLPPHQGVRPTLAGAIRLPRDADAVEAVIVDLPEEAVRQSDIGCRNISHRGVRADTGLVCMVFLFLNDHPAGDFFSIRKNVSLQLTIGM